MIVSLIREHHWPPEIIGGLFIDDQDYEGVEFLYEDLLKMHAEAKNIK